MNKPFKIGALLGGGLGLVIAIGMDLIMGGTITNGGWADAVAKDLNLLFNSNYENTDLIVIFCVFLVIGFMVIISALLGGALASLLSAFFDFMTKKGKSIIDE